MVMTKMESRLLIVLKENQVRQLADSLITELNSNYMKVEKHKKLLKTKNQSYGKK
jgi:hypothetical protein